MAYFYIKGPLVGINGCITTLILPFSGFRNLFPYSYKHYQVGLFKLRQYCSMAHYQENFEEICISVLDIPPEVILNCFISSLSHLYQAHFQCNCWCFLNSLINAQDQPNSLIQHLSPHWSITQPTPASQPTAIPFLLASPTPHRIGPICSSITMPHSTLRARFLLKWRVLLWELWSVGLVDAGFQHQYA